MSIPASWVQVPLWNAGDITTGNTPPTKRPDLYGQDIPFAKPGDLNRQVPITKTEQMLSYIGAATARPVRQGAVLVSCIGNLGKVGVAGVELATNQQINSIEFYNDIVLDRYGYYACKTLKPWMEKEASATTIAILNKGKFSEALINIAPLAEQRRIVNKLDTVLARVDKVSDRLARVAPLLKRFRQSVLTAATSGRLTEQWRGTTECGWSIERADAVCTKVQSGGTPKAGFADSGVPFLKVYNIVEQKVAFDYKPQFVTRSIHDGELKKSQAVPGDVLMNIVGPPLGKVAVVPSDHGQWNINQAITLFRSSTRVSSAWLYIVLCEGAPIREVLASTKGSVGQVNISLSQCRAFQFPVPSLMEQAEIVRRVELLFAYADRLGTRLNLAENATKRLTPALLSKAFRGELVAQDPKDEPADELLRRLRTVTTSVTAKRGRGKAK